MVLFVPGTPIRLADGATWQLPPIIAELMPAGIGGRLVSCPAWRVSGRPYDEGFDDRLQDALDALDDAFADDEPPGAPLPPPAKPVAVAAP